MSSMRVINDDDSINESDGDYNSKEDSLNQQSDQTSTDAKIKEYEKEQEQEKTQLAAKIRKENENFLRSVEQGRVERLKFILKQSEIYTHFLINNKVEDNNNNNSNNNNNNNKNKKTTVKRTKRKKSEETDIELLQQKNNIDDDDFKMEQKQITRLYYQPSILTGGKLTDYQLNGLNWLIALYERGLNGILADEMGLGKTIQSIAFMAYLKQFQKKNGYFLVIVPKSTMPNWTRECKLWFPTLHCVVLNPVKEEREEALKKIIKHKFQCVITSYEGVNICINKLRKIKWELLIIDEAHRIKNENALLSRNVRNLESKFRLLVTGTPLQNNLHELWALLNFLLPDIFSSSQDFDDWFGLGDKKDNNNNENNNNDNNEKTTEELQEERNAEIVQQLHKILRPFLLRRTKAEVEKTLPPKKEIHIKVGLTELQKNLYKKLLTSSLLQESKTIYKNIIMQLRKVCNHPYLFDGVEQPNPPENHLVLYSSKMRILDKLCTKLFGKSQILIFSQMTRMLDILEDYCIEKGYRLCRIDGDTSLEERESQIQEFTKPNSDIFIFLLSTRAGGLGLNLMTSDTVILYDSDWNPQVDLQAMDRVHRIGQTKPVLIYRLICENTIEEKIIERQAMRLKLDSLVIQQGRVLKSGESFTKEQMKEMIQYGADAIFRAGEDFKDEDIDIILERGEKQTNQFFEAAEQQAKSKSNLLLNFTFEPNDLYKFENEDYSKKRKEEADKALSLAYAEELENENKILNAKRERGHVNYNVDQQQAQLLNSKLNKKKSKNVKIPIYHLYKNRDRILELKQKQINYFQDNGKKIPEKFDEDATIFEGLNEQEKNELIELFKTGFVNWDKREYETFILKTEEVGKDEIELIAKEIPTKTFEEVREYSNAFWERINEIPDGQKIMRNMEKKERLEKQRNLSIKLINKKCEGNIDYDDIKINYPNNNHQSEYSLEEDQYLIFITNECGYGNWDDIVREIKLSDDLMFNYYLKSRNKNEIQKRVDYLVKVIEKEFGHISVNNGNKNNNNNNRSAGNSEKKNHHKMDVVEEDDKKNDINNNINNVDDENENKHIQININNKNNYDEDNNNEHNKVITIDEDNSKDDDNITITDNENENNDEDNNINEDNNNEQNDIKKMEIDNEQ